MEFKLRLESDRPTNGDLVLEAETPLEGVQFIEQMGKSLRRSIDHVGRGRHFTLGALPTYEVTVPQQMAIESGKFEGVYTHTIILEHNLLSHFIFYAANVHTGPAGRRCYPFTENEATLISLIDELAFLDAWANTGYASRLMMNGNQVVSGEWNAPSGDSSYGGNCVGCTGCTCGKDDHVHHHHHGCPPPPKPPIIGNPSGPFAM